MKDKKWLVYFVSVPLIIITIFLYIFFFSEVGIDDVIHSIKLKMYIVLGFVIAITAIHLIVKNFYKYK